MRRLLRVVGLLGAIFALVLSGPPNHPGRPEAAQAAATTQAGLLPGLPDLPFLPKLPTPCDLLSGTAKTVCKIAVDPIGAIPGVGGLGIPNPVAILKNAANDAFDNGVKSLAKDFANSMLRGLFQNQTFINKSTTPDLTQPWYKNEFNQFLAIGLVFFFIAWALRVLVAIKRVEPNRAGNATLRWLTLIAFAPSLPVLYGKIVTALDNDVAPTIMKSGTINGNHYFDQLINALVDQLGGLLGGTAAAVIIMVAGAIGVLINLLFQVLFVLRIVAIYWVLIETVIVGVFWIWTPDSGEKFWRRILILAALAVSKVLAAFIFYTNTRIILNSHFSFDIIVVVAALMLAEIIGPVLIVRRAARWDYDPVGYIHDKGQDAFSWTKDKALDRWGPAKKVVEVDAT